MTVTVNEEAVRISQERVKRTPITGPYPDTVSQTENLFHFDDVKIMWRKVQIFSFDTFDKTIDIWKNLHIDDGMESLPAVTCERGGEEQLSLDPDTVSQTGNVVHVVENSL